ncbi:ADP-ribosylglycohydrolase family protein [Chloroflexia bacterium SDU3-3]|nr:ADP-ribosylglycohydrolase family protein [Chloroflexia bacterium SDU3-3]
MATAQDKFSGCLLGGAVGDALGLPSENLSRERIRRVYGRLTDYQIRPRWGYYTDDTQMAIALAEVLAEHQRFDTEAFRRKLARWIMVPLRLGGRSTKNAAWRCALGLRDTGRHVPGTSGAMRIAPLALAYHADPDALLEQTVACCQVTHTHPSAIAGSILAAFAVAYALNHEKLVVADFLDAIASPASQYDADLAQRVRELPALLALPEEQVFAHLLANSTMWGSPIADVILMALFAFLRTPDDFEQSILTCVNAGWDTDTMACICGHISGAWNGLAAIPERWLANLENGYKGRDYLLGLALALCDRQPNYRAPRGPLDFLADVGRNSAFQFNLLTRKRMI